MDPILIHLVKDVTSCFKEIHINIIFSFTSTFPAMFLFLLESL